MFKDLAKNIIHDLWMTYQHNNLQMQQVSASLKAKGLNPILDHFAIIDLPGPYSGIPTLSQIFKLLGFQERGRDYLHNKQNDFVWMAMADCETTRVIEVLPQVVVADFRLEDFSPKAAAIIEKYAKKSTPFPFDQAQTLMAQSQTEALRALIVNYLSTRDWPLPTLAEYHTVREFNELIAWVLVFGRQPNHFTLSTHLLSFFENFETFQCFIEEEVGLPLNKEGGKVKGNEHVGIKQGATCDQLTQIKLCDGEIKIPTGFVEFVWRYPLHNQQFPINTIKDRLWGEFYTGFIAQQANRIIESLYLKYT